MHCWQTWTSLEPRSLYPLSTFDTLTQQQQQKKKKPAQLRCSCSGVEEPGNDEASSLTSHVLGSGIGAFQKFYILTVYTLFIRNESLAYKQTSEPNACGFQL